MPNEFMRDAWAPEIVEQAMRGMVVADLFAPPYPCVEVPRNPEWLAERADFGNKWQALVQLGLDAGFLTDEEDGLHLTTETTEWVRAEGPIRKPRTWGRSTIRIPTVGDG